MIKDKRKDRPAPDIDPELIKAGTAQLTSEIEILENWLKDLEQAESLDEPAREARRAYLDMLRSRREMLNALQEAQTAGS